MPVLQPKIQELADLLNAELHRPKSDQLSLKRLQRDIAALRSAPDPSIRNEALVLLGVIDALRFDVESTKIRFEQALAASSYSSNVYVNYAVALTALGYFSDAFSKIEIAVEKAAEIDTIRLAVAFASNAFAVDKVTHYASWLQRLNVPDDDPNVKKALEASSWQTVILSVPGVTRDALLQRYELARSIARKHQLRIADERATTSTRGVLLEWAAACEADEVDEMNFETAVALGELSSDPSEMLISFGYAKQTPNLEKAA